MQRGKTIRAYENVQSFPVVEGFPPGCSLVLSIGNAQTLRYFI